MIRTITAITLAVSVATAPAFAASDTFKMEIDLNRAQLASVEGAKEEYTRIRKDVRERCAAEHAEFRFGKAYVIGQCERRTMNNIVANIDDANFSKAHYKSN
ncbi:MAG: UrcA family protein [Hyphomonas sp.]|nr:UrcA family protein [Hyphomonas sp.]